MVGSGGGERPSGLPQGVRMGMAAEAGAPLCPVAVPPELQGGSWQPRGGYLQALSKRGCDRTLSALEGRGRSCAGCVPAAGHRGWQVLRVCPATGRRQQWPCVCPRAGAPGPSAGSGQGRSCAGLTDEDKDEEGRGGIGPHLCCSPAVEAPGPPVSYPALLCQVTPDVPLCCLPRVPVGGQGLLGSP